MQKGILLMITTEIIHPDYFDLAAQWLSDDEINCWLTSEWRGQRVNARLITILLRSKKNRLLMVCHEGKPCGLVGFSELDETDRVAMIWYLLGQRTQGSKGVISTAVSQALRVAFRDYKLSCVYAWIIEDNHGSRRVLEKNGFRELGRIRSATRRGDNQLDRIYFDITSQDYDAL